MKHDWDDGELVQFGSCKVEAAPKTDTMELIEKNQFFLVYERHVIITNISS